MKTYVVFTIFFASLSFSLYSQSRLDSLHQNLEAAKQDSSLAVAYEALALYWKDNNTDSTQHYFAKSTRVLRTLPQDYAHNKLRYRIHGYVTTMFTDVNRFPEARVHILYMQHLALQYNNQTWLANSQLLLGLVAMQTNQMDTAKYYFDKAMAVALPKKVWDVTTKIYGNLGIYYFYNGQSDSSYHCMLEAVKYAKLSKHAYFLANAYNNLATLEFKRGNLNGSVRYLKESQKIYKQLKNRSGEMYALMNLANNYHQVGQESEALDTYFMALQINSGLKDQVMEASFYKNIGEVYFTIGDISNATVYLMKSITLRETLNDTKGLNNSLFMLSELMQREAKYLKAKQYLQEILTNCQTNGDDQFGNKTRASLANVYAELAMPDSAEYYFKKATEQLRENSQNLDLSYALLNYAAFCQAQSRISDAEKNYREAKQLFQETEDHPGEVGALNGLASLQWKQYNIATKKQYLSKIVNLASKAYQLSQENGLLQEKADAARLLRQAYQAMKQLTNAYKYALIEIAITDTLNKKEQKKILYNAEARWQTERKQKQIDKLKQNKIQQDLEIKNKTAEIQTQFLIFVGISIVGILLLLVTILLFVISRKNANLRYKEQLQNMAKIRFENMRNRISPHFLFNSLGAVSQYLPENTDAKQKLQAIVEMLRSSLLNVERPTITTADEISFIRNFLLLQPESFSQNLEVEIQIPNEILPTELPSMLLQIPVENALKHGLANKTTGEKKLSIKATHNHAETIYTITDNGVGRSLANQQAHPHSTKTGMKVITQTLYLLNKNNHNKIHFNINDLHNPEGKAIGTEVEIRIPSHYNYKL